MSLTFTNTDTAQTRLPQSVPAPAIPTGNHPSRGATRPNITGDPSSAEMGPDFPVSGMLRALRRRWYAIIPGAVLAAALAGWLGREFLPAQSYTARTLLHVSADRPRILFDSGDSR